MTEKEFWLMIRRALLMIVGAIEKKYLGTTKVDTTYEDGFSVTYDGDN